MGTVLGCKVLGEILEEGNGPGGIVLEE